MKCECGNNRFYAHQLCCTDVIVDEYNNWQSTFFTDCSSCSGPGIPYGPYRCTKCGKEYKENHED